MTALDDAVHRIRTDATFRAAVADDPSVALRDHPLGPDDLLVLVDEARRTGP